MAENSPRIITYAVKSECRDCGRTVKASVRQRRRPASLYVRCSACEHIVNADDWRGLDDGEKGDPE